MFMWPFGALAYVTGDAFFGCRMQAAGAKVTLWIRMSYTWRSGVLVNGSTTVVTTCFSPKVRLVRL